MSKILVNSNIKGKLGAMSDVKTAKVESAKLIFEERGLIYSEHPNGQLSIDKIRIWTTTESWYNARTGERGKGINSYLRHLELQGLEFR